MADTVLLFSIILLIGLALGSFVTALCHRLPRDINITTARSCCPHCHTPLRAADLVPVLSWLLLRGKCCHCKTPIHWRYPVIELLVAIGFCFSVWLWGFNLQGAAMGLVWVCLVAMSVIDLEHRILPDALQWVLLLLAIFYHAFAIAPLHGSSAAESYMEPLLLASALLFGLGYGLRWYYLRFRGLDALGLGDVKFFAVAGLWIGLNSIPLFLLISGIGGVIIGLAWRRFTHEAQFPFGPALCIALYATLLLGHMEISFP